MDKTTEEHAAEMQAVFDQFYATHKDVATIVEGFDMMLEVLEAPSEIRENLLTGLGLVAHSAFLAGSKHGSTLSMDLASEKFKDLAKKG